MLEVARRCVYLDALITCHGDHMHAVAVALFLHRSTKEVYEVIKA